MKKISIIIPTKNIDNYIKEAIIKHQELDYEDFELLIIPDEIKIEDVELLQLQYTKEGYLYKSNEKIRIMPFASAGPSEKRNFACKNAKGDYFAFIDGDAYPSKDWLKNAQQELKDKNIGAVGGPAISAPTNDIWEDGSGKVYESFLVTGKYNYRYKEKRKREVKELPTVNLIVKKQVFKKIKGFKNSLYPGEDTKLCLDIINAGYKIMYSKDTLVFHHRKPLFKEHLKQVAKYAKHRGHFVKKYPKTSLKIEFFVPTLFVLWLLLFPFVCEFILKSWNLYFLTLLLYLLLAIFSLKGCKSIKTFVISFVGIILTNVVYGVEFLHGLFCKELKK